MKQDSFQNYRFDIKGGVLCELGSFLLAHPVKIIKNNKRKAKHIKLQKYILILITPLIQLRKGYHDILKREI